MGIKIITSGTYLPGDPVSSEELSIETGYPVSKIDNTTKIKKRHRVGRNELPSDMAVKAINSALDGADLCIEDIDCLISASASKDQSIPYNAAIIHSKLNPDTDMATFDVNSTCLSFVSALQIANSLLETNQYKRIAIVSAETASIGTDWSKLETAGIFGDGSVAFVLENTESSNKICMLHETFSEGVDMCKAEAGGMKFHPSRGATWDEYKDAANFKMQGKSLFKLIHKNIASFAQRLWDKSSLTMDDIACVVPHQASYQGLTHIQKLLGIGEDKMINIFPENGNQIAASIPIALHHALKTKDFCYGDKILLIGTSAGVSMAGLIFTYE